MTNISVLADNSTKAKIIELISGEWPLSAKKIYKILVRNYKLSITYQGIHKSLGELLESKILEKRKEGYLLNKDWVQEIGEFSERVKNDLESGNIRRDVKTFHKLTFDKHSDFIKFHMNLVRETFMKEKKVDMAFYFRHVPYPNVLPNDEIEKLKPVMSKIKWKIFSNHSTNLDKWCAKYWKKLGVQVKVGQDIPTNTMLILLNDYITSVYLSKEAIKKWDSIFSIKSLQNADINKMTETLIEKRYKSVVTIIKDKELASLLRQ
ncbi:MAG: hypothetical protein AABW50_00690 [Nanoarchaeota archaeon]